MRVVPPPTETNFACAWLTGSLDACKAAALADVALADVALAPRR